MFELDDIAVLNRAYDLLDPATQYRIEYVGKRETYFRNVKEGCGCYMKNWQVAEMVRRGIATAIGKAA